MPPFDYSGFTNIGAGISRTIAEKRKRDKEKEDRERTARMLAQYGFPIQTIGDVAAGADPGLAIELAEDQEKKFKEQDKLKAEAQARDAETKEFDSRMSQFGAQYPLSPEQQAVKSAYPDKTPEQQDSYFGDLAKIHQKSQANALQGQLERDPSRKLSASEIEALYPNDKGKVIGYTGRTYAELKASEQPKTGQEPRDRVFDIQVGQRREIAKIRGLKEDSPEWREYVYGLNVQGEFPNDRSIGGLVAQAYRDITQREFQLSTEAKKAQSVGMPFDYTPMSEDQKKAEAVRVALGVASLQKQATGGQVPTPSSGKDVGSMTDEELEELLNKLKADSTGANY